MFTKEVSKCCEDELLITEVKGKYKCGKCKELCEIIEVETEPCYICMKVDCICDDAYENYKANQY